MSDLISRKALIADVKKYVSGTPLQEMFETIIDKQPIAYDVDKVVEKLESIRKDENIRFADQVVSRAINIVKGGLEDE